MSNPLLMVEYSDDHGRTWSSERHYDLGDAGDFYKRVELHQQGSAIQRVYRLKFTENRAFTIISANADIRIGE